MVVMVIFWVLRVLMAVSHFRAHPKVLVSSRLLGSWVLFISKFSLYMLIVGVEISQFNLVWNWHYLVDIEITMVEVVILMTTSITVPDGTKMD